MMEMTPKQVVEKLRKMNPPNLWAYSPKMSVEDDSEDLNEFIKLGYTENI
jgi:hypothetical protein